MLVRGARQGVFETGWETDTSHRPYFVTRPVVLWLERILDLPNWSSADIRSMPETHISEWASQAGVMLGLENLDTPYVDGLSKALAIIREIDSPWLQLYPDIGNLAAAGYNPPDELTLARNQVLGIHVKDALPRVIRGVPFEKGIVPFRETFQALAQMGFWGLLGVEIWGQMHSGEDPIASVAAARRFVDCLVSEAWPANRPVGLPVQNYQDATVMTVGF